MTEAELRQQVVHLAKELGWRVFSLPMNRTVRPVKDAIGYPDLTLARNGDVLWIELKSDSYHLTPAQEAWRRDLPAVLVIRPGDLAGLALTLGATV